MSHTNYWRYMKDQFSALDKRKPQLVAMLDGS
jgi:hypothetical protein